MEAIDSYQITFDSDWFRSGYYVYVVKIEHYKKGTFYYIGQTGDRHHVAARSPFYRLMGHFNPYIIKNGTDSQLIKGLLKLGLIETPEKPKNARICMEEAIASKST